MESAASGKDTQRLGLLADVLLNHELVLDVVSLHIPIRDVIYHCLACIEDFEYETVGEYCFVLCRCDMTLNSTQAIPKAFILKWDA